VYAFCVDIMPLQFVHVGAPVAQSVARYLYNLSMLTHMSFVPFLMYHHFFTESPVNELL
jgi:hypothetical protein